MQFRGGDEDNFNFDMTPMIDVVFLLLIFFMVSTVFVDFSRRMDISLPSSKTSVVDEVPDTIQIEMTADKQIFRNGKKITVALLENWLKETSQEANRTAIIRADKGIPYGEVIKVMGILQSAKVLDISVAVK
ncbi:MAG: ExbD/TolR family protein [Nitrospinales bacterium]